MPISHYSKSAVFYLIIFESTNHITPLFETNKLKCRMIKDSNILVVPLKPESKSPVSLFNRIFLILPI